MIKFFLKHLEFLKPHIITIIGCIVVLALWTLDYYIIGQEITFTLLYLIPVGLTVWFGGINGGIITSILSTFTWFIVYSNRESFPEITPVIIINFILKLSVYLVFSYILNRLNQNLLHEKELSATDALTDAMNRRAFNKILKSEIARSSRYGHPISLIYFDVDNFKTINDKYGHNTGDKLLKKISETAKGNLRNTDVFARMGGDEFAVLLPETGYPEAEKVTALLNKALNKMVNNLHLPCSFSIGMVSYRNAPENPEEIIGKADNLMYYSKNQGKSRITSENCESSNKL